MKLTDKIAAHQSNRPLYTFEFFPPRTDQGFENLLPRISRLAALNPLAISITWGAGGSTKERTLDLCEIVQMQCGIDTIMHLTCTNMEKGMVDDALRAAKARGIQTILALRGDPPRGEESWTAIDSRFAHGIDLVSYIRSSPEFSSYFCIGVAAYPDGHPDRNSISEDKQIDYLKTKIDAGADFIVTQLFYDVDAFVKWLAKIREKGINVPVIPGIMPIQTYSSFNRLVKLCGSRVTPAIASALEPICHDDQKVKDYGVQLSVSMIRQLTKCGISGIHFSTLNLEKSVQRVLETLEWIPRAGFAVPNRLISDSPSTDKVHLINATCATTKAANGLATLPAHETEAGKGELNNASTWDDFPNGRFGDPKSPAYGDQGLWGGLSIPTDDFVLWGNPKTMSDLTGIFLRYLQSALPTTPFSSEPLSAESKLILPHLIELTSRGFWTVGSQPAIDGAPSEDSIVGWGPRRGYVFQKSFVEFYCPESVVRKIQDKAVLEGGGWVSWFAARDGNGVGEIRSNVPKDGRNAVTWGVFPGQEVAQSTIIEKESFLSWKNEAFSILAAWASFYPPGSEERHLLESVRETRWLVNIVHHDYKNSKALWSFLFDGLTLETGTPS